MNINNAIEKIERLRTSGFTITDAEINAILNSDVKTGDAEVIRYAVLLARAADKNLLIINNLDLSTSLGPILGLDRKLINTTAFAIYILGKSICETLYGGTIVARDSEFIANLDHIEEYKAQRELIKKNHYALIYDKEKATINSYGISRLSGNLTNHSDVCVDVSELSESEIVILRNDIDKHCSLRIRSGKYPTLLIHLQNFTTFDHVITKEEEVFEPLIVPGKMLRIHLKSSRRV